MLGSQGISLMKPTDLKRLKTTFEITLKYLGKDLLEFCEWV